MDWTDPLRNLAPSATHPAPSSVASSKLSSVFADNERWYETRTELLKMLDDDYIPNSPEDDTIKILGTFLIKLPKEGQLVLMSEIYDLKHEPAKLRRLRNFLVDAILRPMKAAGGQSPKTPISAFPDQRAREEILHSMSEIEPSYRKDQKALKADCLRRDGYRCAISRYIESSTFDKAQGSAGPTQAVPTQCAHILPFALRNFDEQSAQETENKATIWWALHRYFPELKDLIGSGNINQHQNALTMWNTLHTEFGNFHLAFEPLGNNRYQGRWLRYEGVGVPDLITLTSKDPSVPLPNPKYLEVHFRIAEILEWFRTGEVALALIEAEESPMLDPIATDHLVHGVGGAVN